ncbi:hypothetical protein GCM10010922_04410 [Microbacterium sorbitolivorans]|uniref:Uncharacterized protein n=1 Tax=Microbacterium sorbitolivorans TaxID=1867410 RepID=A0A367Y8T5_9MICO|nr:hypothetical protein [Microbacterium sorbitolivorans]RCK61411.1 hypothetical protein DTO57_01835 [Microbacterium sorbitolivorans]GGF32421.1 hypothetical protein GCM10010922_04410 [Microbacterium sorbitolivorans]
MDINFAEIGISALRVLGAGLLLGAGLPALFALGMRLHAIGSGAAEDGTIERRKPIATIGAYVLYAVVILAVLAGVLFVTRHSLGHYFGITLFGG